MRTKVKHSPQSDQGSRRSSRQSKQKQVLTTPLVSVIIPVYNAEQTIVQAARSVLLNSYEHLELILVDDGSQDQSLAACQELARKDRRVKVFSQDNGGASSARNLGLQQATGEYVCFVDADDQVEADFVQTLYDLMQQPKVALAGTGMWRRRDRAKKMQRLYARPVRAREEKESLSEYVLYLLNQDGRLYPVCNKMFQASVIRQNHLGFDPTLDFAEDTKFVLEYLAFAQGEIAFTEQPLYIYNLNTAGGTVGKSSTYWRNWQKSLDFVRSWVQRNSTARRTTTVLERERLQQLEQRWRVSHALAVGRSRQSFLAKCKQLNVFLVIPATIVAKLRG